ncbi:MAG: Bax inhibitor-1/YccA family protein [Wolbachia endosymbiont of Menacanthus eurysternus]|nr:MAG: Bax inhibitor-1/YccA family protein [Wolbachia endosymbiont of Menacanthus eurysternus]
MSYMRNEQDIRSRGVYYSTGLRDYLVKVYNYMALALGVTGLIAFLTVFSGLFRIIYSNPFLSLIVALSPVALVFYMSYRLQYLSAQSTIAVFFLFSALMGLSLSHIFVIYTAENIARAFFITSIMFGSMALYGNTTRRDLTSMGSFLMMGIWGLIIASVINLFLGSNPVYFAISFISVVLFTLLTAYDSQRIKDVYYKYNDGSEVATTKLAILGATNLYFDFINIFLNLLRLVNLFNNSKD